MRHPSTERRGVPNEMGVGACKSKILYLPPSLVPSLFFSACRGTSNLRVATRTGENGYSGESVDGDFPWLSRDR